MSIPSKPKIWLTLVCGEGSYTDLQELWEPIKEHFTGLCAVCHAAPDSMEAKYLDIVKGEGRIIYMPYVGRHDMSRNVALHCGAIQDGDWVVQTDVLEHPQPWFLETLAPLFMAEGRVNCCYYYGKPFLFEYHESITYQGTPHENWVRQDGKGQAIELAHAWPDESKIRLNVRPRKRDKWHFVKHYGKYSLLPYGSNHYILPLSGKLNAREIFEKRETARMSFIYLLRELGIKRDVDSVIEYMKGKMDPRFMAHVEVDKVWNDIYRFFILKREDFIDDHDWNNVVQIPLDNPPQSK